MAMGAKAKDFDQFTHHVTLDLNSGVKIQVSKHDLVLRGDNSYLLKKDAKIHIFPASLKDVKQEEQKDITVLVPDECVQRIRAA